MLEIATNKNAMGFLSITGILIREIQIFHLKTYVTLRLLRLNWLGHNHNLFFSFISQPSVVVNVFLVRTQKRSQPFQFQVSEKKKKSAIR